MKTTPLAGQILAEAGADLQARTTDARAALDRIATMVGHLRAAQDAADSAELELKRRKALLLKIEREDLPELLRESGFEAVALSDGTNVQIQDDISCSLPEARASEGHKWLRDNELGSIIKTLVQVSFGKDELEQADALYGRLLNEYPQDAVAETEKVHPQTLKAALKERIAGGLPLPMELFGVQPYSWAKLTTAKAKKP